MDASAHPPRLLALRALKLGDLLVAVPAMRGLRRGFPDHRILLAVPGWLDPIVQLIRGVDELVSTPGLNDLLPIDPGTVAQVTFDLTRDRRQGERQPSRGLHQADARDLAQIVQVEIPTVVASGRASRRDRGG